MKKITMRFKKVFSLVLMVVVGSSCCSFSGTVFAQVAPHFAGQLSVRGVVTLNGLSASSGATVFDGGMVTTEDSGSAIITLGKLGQIDLEPGSELILRLGARTIGGQLRSGQATVIAPSGITVNLATSDGIAIADGKEASILTVNVASGSTKVQSVRNNAKVTVGDQVEVIAAGQEIAIGSQNGQQRTRKGGVIPNSPGGVAGAVGGLTTGALATLLILGFGGALAGIITTVQGDKKVSGGTLVLSNFR